MSDANDDPFSRQSPEAWEPEPLDRLVAVKTGAPGTGWERKRWPGEMSRGGREPWPMKMLEQALPGDELWWFCSSPETWDHLCGRAGWVLVRDGREIDFECTVLN